MVAGGVPMYVLTMCLSRRRDMTGVVEIGRNSLGCTGFVTFGTGVILAVFYCCGTTAAAMDWLNRSAMGAAKTEAPSRRNQAGILSPLP